MPRSFSSAIQSEVACRAVLRPFTAPAIWIAPPNSSSFSVSVVLPASGWLTMAKVRRRRVSWRCECMEAGRLEREPAIVAWIGDGPWLCSLSPGNAGGEGWGEGLLLCWLRCACKARAFVRLRRPSYFSLCVAKEKVTKEKGHPAWRLPPIPGRQVREAGPGFSNGHPARAKRSRHPVDSRCAACRPRLTAAQGPRVEQRAIGQPLLRCLNSGIHALAWRALGTPPLRGGGRAGRTSLRLECYLPECGRLGSARSRRAKSAH